MAGYHRFSATELVPWRQIVRLPRASYLLLDRCKAQQVLRVAERVEVHVPKVPTREHSIVLAGRLLGQAEEDDWPQLGDGYDAEDREHDDEDGAEGESELAFMPLQILERLLDEKSELAIAVQPSEPLVFVLLFILLRLCSDVFREVWRARTQKVARLERA